MFCFFIDESGLPRLDKIHPSSPHFILGGVIIADDNYQKVCNDIEAFKLKHLNELVDPKSLKIHASALFNCRDSFSGLTKEICIKIGIEFYKLIAKSDVTVVVTAIQKEKLLEKYKEAAQDPYPLAWLYSCERYNRFLSEKKVDSGRSCLEERGVGLDKVYKDRLDCYLDMGTKYRNLERVEKPTFGNFEKNPPLQMADFVCYSIHKRLNKSEDRFFNIIKNKFRGAPDKVDGYGLVYFPK